jgi:putative methyltransferase (TIGR04325 family)
MIRAKISQYMLNQKINFLTKTFVTYKECKNYCESKNKNNYENQYLTNYRLKKFSQNYYNIKKLFLPDFKTLLEVIIIYMSHYKKIPKILDVGGGFGHCGIYLQKLLNKNIRYEIVETPSLIRNASKLKLNNIKFHKNFEGLDKNKYDIIFSSSTIQYLERPYDIIKILCKSNSMYIAFTRNSFTKKTKILSQVSQLKKNGFGKSPKKFEDNKFYFIPHTTIVKEKLIKIMKSYNYKIILNNNYTESKIGKNKIYSEDIIFSK